MDHMFKGKSEFIRALAEKMGVPVVVVEMSREALEITDGVTIIIPPPRMTEAERHLFNIQTDERMNKLLEEQGFEIPSRNDVGEMGAHYRPVLEHCEEAHRKTISGAVIMVGDELDYPVQRHPDFQVFPAGSNKLSRILKDVEPPTIDVTHEVERGSNQPEPKWYAKFDKKKRK